jgi:hypothetical protein
MWLYIKVIFFEDVLFKGVNNLLDYPLPSVAYFTKNHNFFDNLVKGVTFVQIL